MDAGFDPDIDRRDFLRLLAAGAGAATASASPAAAAAPSADSDKKQRARYQANSSDVQNFYRVNRYPPKR
jgi:anaerobic selenocysteine-containing dehydrogenase